MKALRYLFYEQLSTESKLSPARWFIPLLVTSIMLTLNILTLAVVLAEMLGVGALLGVMRNWGAAAIVLPTLALVFLVLYVLWINSDQYTRFRAEFQNESDRQRQVRNVLIEVYRLLSLVSLPIVALIVRS